MNQTKRQKLEAIYLSRATPEERLTYEKKKLAKKVALLEEMPPDYMQGPQGPEGNTGATGAQGPRGLTGPAGPRGPAGQASLGAFPGQELSNPRLTVNGFATESFGFAMNTASTTLCNIRTPNATTTLTFASGQVNVATGTALYLEFGKSVSPSATTTSLGKANLASGTTGTFIASTTPADFASSGGSIDGQRVLAPNTYLALKMGGVTPAVNTMAGSCRIEFKLN